MTPRTPKVNCLFCAKSQDDVAKIIAEPGAVYICNECVDVCDEIIAIESVDEPGISPNELRGLLLRAAHLLSGTEPDFAAELQAAARRITELSARSLTGRVRHGRGWSGPSPCLVMPGGQAGDRAGGDGSVISRR